MYRILISCVNTVFFFFKQKTAYDMRSSDGSSDVCSSDLAHVVWVADALEEHRQVCDRPEPGEVVPGHARVAEDRRPQARGRPDVVLGRPLELRPEHRVAEVVGEERKSTRLNSRH